MFTQELYDIIIFFIDSKRNLCFCLCIPVTDDEEGKKTQPSDSVSYKAGATDSVTALTVSQRHTDE